MTILGLDPGLAAYGWGAIRLEGQVRTYLAHGCIKTEPTGLGVNADIGVRCQVLESELLRLVEELRPDEIATEAFVFFGNPYTSSAIAMGNVLGMTRSALGSLPCTEYTTQQVKRAVTGKARSEKGMVGNWVRALLRLKDIPRPVHAADALAVALAHTNLRGRSKR